MVSSTAWNGEGDLSTKLRKSAAAARCSDAVDLALLWIELSSEEVADLLDILVNWRTVEKMNMRQNATENRLQSWFLAYRAWVAYLPPH